MFSLNFSIKPTIDPIPRTRALAWRASGRVGRLLSLLGGLLGVGDDGAGSGPGASASLTHPMVRREGTVRIEFRGIAGAERHLILPRRQLGLYPAATIGCRARDIGVARRALLQMLLPFHRLVSRSRNENQIGYFPAVSLACTRRRRSVAVRAISA